MLFFFIEASCMKLLVLWHSEFDFILLSPPKDIFDGPWDWSWELAVCRRQRAPIRAASRIWCILFVLNKSKSEMMMLQSTAFWKSREALWVLWPAGANGVRCWRPEEEHAAERAGRMDRGFGWSGECLIPSTQGHKVQINFLDCFPVNEKCLEVDTNPFHLGWLKHSFY